MAITTMPRMLARLTATMGLTGLSAECLSAPDPGMAGAMVGEVDGAEVGVMADAATTVGVVTQATADAATREATAELAGIAARLAADIAEPVEADSTEPAAAGFTAVVVEASTVEAGADTANLLGAR
jgi:hypothetical protein